MKPRAAGSPVLLALPPLEVGGRGGGPGSPVLQGIPLPKELLVTLLRGYLDVKALLVMGTVNRGFHNLIEEDRALWQVRRFDTKPEHLRTQVANLLLTLHSNSFGWSAGY